MKAFSAVVTLSAILTHSALANHDWRSYEVSNTVTVHQQVPSGAWGPTVNPCTNGRLPSSIVCWTNSNAKIVPYQVDENTGSIKCLNTNSGPDSHSYTAICIRP